MAEPSKQPQIAVAEALDLLQTFRGVDLTRTIYQIEKSLKGVCTESYQSVLTTSGAKAEVLGAAGSIKQQARLMWSSTRWGCSFVFLIFCDLAK